VPAPRDEKRELIVEIERHLMRVGEKDWRELGERSSNSATSLTSYNTLVVDSPVAVLKESGDVILSKAPIYAEVGRCRPHQTQAAFGLHDSLQVGRDRRRGHRCCSAGVR
jgi:hypothetical protein